MGKAASSKVRSRAPGTRRDVLAGILTAVTVLLLVTPGAHAQNNFLSLNNGSEAGLLVPGLFSSGTSPNLYYRCFSREVLYAPQDGSPAGLDVTGFQLVAITSFPQVGYPLVFFVQDSSMTCLLSAAIGGGFPPNQGKILSSPNTLAAFSFYTPNPSTWPFAFWLSFQGSVATFQAPDPASGGGNLLAGWSDRQNTSTANYFLPILSRNETSSAKSRSFMNLNAAGMGNLRLTSEQEWAFSLEVREATIQPEMTRSDGTWDPAGAGGYSPPVSPWSQLRFRSMDLGRGGTGVVSLAVANLTFQASADACHLPGVTILGQHSPVNVDFFWVLTASTLAGGPYAPPAPGGPFWNPNAGWTVGGDSISPPLPVGLPGLIGLQMCFGSFGLDPAGPPLLVAASQGSTLRFH